MKKQTKWLKYWGRKLADSFVREGTWRYINVSVDGEIVETVFIGVTKSGQVDVQSIANNPHAKWLRREARREVVSNNGVKRIGSAVISSVGGEK